MTGFTYRGKPLFWNYENKDLGFQEGGTGFPSYAREGTVVTYEDGSRIRRTSGGIWMDWFGVDKPKESESDFIKRKSGVYNNIFKEDQTTYNIGDILENNDPVSHPSHYTRFKGIEVIQLTEQLNFCRGNAVKYIARAGAKDDSKEIEDLEKARWYIDREIERLKGEK